jgi:hypothetical protein
MNVKAVAVAIIALSSSAAVIACVLADPPPIVTPAPQEPPRILVDSVTPPPGQIVKTIPPCTNLTDCFVVPVAVDLNASIKWRVFIDLDPTTAPQVFYGGDNDGGVLAVAPDAGAGIRTISFNPQAITTFTASDCHVITFVVAYDFFPEDFAKPLPPGGDTVTWFYQPTQDCTFYDAGFFDAGVTEGGAD